MKINRIGKFDKINHTLIETFESTQEVCDKYNLTKSVML